MVLLLPSVQKITVVSADELSRAARQYNGIEASIVSSFEEIQTASNAGWPVVTLINWYRGHWVVVTGFSGDNIGFNDPLKTSNGFTEISTTDFRRAFEGSYEDQIMIQLSFYPE